MPPPGRVHVVADMAKVIHAGAFTHAQADAPGLPALAAGSNDIVIHMAKAHFLFRGKQADGIRSTTPSENSGRNRVSSTALHFLYFHLGYQALKVFGVNELCALGHYAGSAGGNAVAEGLRHVTALLQAQEHAAHHASPAPTVERASTRRAGA